MLPASPTPFSDSVSVSAMLAPHRLPHAIVCAALLLIVGCSDDARVAREIQSQRQRQTQANSRQDNLGEAFNLMQRLVDLNPEKSRRQIAYHLNRWLEQRPESDPVPVPQLLRTINDIVPTDSLAERVSRGGFVPADVSHLRDAYLFRQIVQWVDLPRSDDPLLSEWMDQQEESLGPEQADALRTAGRLFDWTVRNVAFEPRVIQSPGPQAPDLPLGMQFRGAGYRQSDYQTIWRGTGDSLQRAGVFLQLCRQVGIVACVLSLQDGNTGALNPWCVGVLIGEEVYLFEPELGTPVPGPGQVGIATLAQARTDASVLRRLNAPGFFDYPFSKQDVQQCVALLNVVPEGVSARMKKLESGLTGDRRMTVYTDVDAVASQLDSVAGIAGVRLWTVPLLAEVYRAVLEATAERDPLFSFWYYSRWAIIDGGVGASQNLARARWQHLHGQFADDEEENLEGARTLYLGQRAPEFEIEKLDIDVGLQKAYGIRRELGTEKEVYERQIRQAQGMMRLGKRTATYWLALLQYDDEKYSNAENWLAKRVLDEEQRSFWEPAARYNLARSIERSGDADRAIEIYKTDGDPQEHGNRIRARLVGKSADE